MRIFISYCRDSEPAARRVVADLQSLGHEVWFDQALSGGQSWWDLILDEIRKADLFVFLLHPHALESVACTRERGYALALGKPLLPIEVADGVSVNLLPPDLARRQIIPYRTGDRDEALRLARALGSLPPTPALPDPLPAPPEVPASYLGTLAQRIEAESLSYQDQSALLVDLRQALRDPGSQVDADVLLGRLRKRRDLFAAIGDEIDALRERTQPPPRRAGPAPVPAAVPAAGPAPVAPSPNPTALAEPPPDGWHPAWRLAALGLVIGVAGGFGYAALSDRFRMEALLIPAFTTVEGLLCGWIGGRRRGLWPVAAVAAVAGALAWLPFLSGSQRSSDVLAISLIYGAGPAAVVAMVAARLWLRWRR